MKAFGLDIWIRIGSACCVDCCIALAFTRAIFTSFVDTSRGYKRSAYGWSLEDLGGHIGIVSA